MNIFKLLKVIKILKASFQATYKLKYEKAHKLEFLIYDEKDFQAVFEFLMEGK